MSKSRPQVLSGVSFFVVITITSFVCLIQPQSILKGDPPQTGGSLGQCVDPSDYGVPAKCKIYEQSCFGEEPPFCASGTGYGSGKCTDPDDTNDPPTEYDCGALRIESVIDVGYCDMLATTSTPSSETCDLCDYVACASGTYYIDDFDCGAGIHPFSEGFYYTQGACIE